MSSLLSGSGNTSSLVPFLESWGMSQTVIAGLHLVTGNLQMLVCNIMDVMHLLHEVRYELGRRLLFVARSPEEQVAW